MAGKHVVIIGGGIAGLTAAYSLAKQRPATEPPFRITVLEAENETGGQARAFEVPTFAPASAAAPKVEFTADAPVAFLRDGSAGRPVIPPLATVEHGSHVFFNYYDTILKLIEELRADPALGPSMPGFARIPGWTILDAYARRATLEHTSGLPAPYSVLPSMMSIPWLSFTERLKLAWGAFQIIQTRLAQFDEVDRMTSYEFAAQKGFSPVGALTWNAASLGLTNLFVQEQSAAIFVGKHRLLIATPDGLAYRLPAGNLSHLIPVPLSRKLLSLGGAIVTGAEAMGIEAVRGGDRTRVVYRTAAGEAVIEADHVILATTPWRAGPLVPWVKAPWTELRPVTPVITMVLGLSGRVQQSADDRELGCSREYYVFSVITDLSHFWPEFQGEKTVLRVEIGHADQLPFGAELDREELVRIVKRDIDRIFPEALTMRVEWAALHRETKHLYVSWVRGQWAKKPHERDVGQGAFLAGDWTSRGTIGMEAAANSGIEAANHVLRAAGIVEIPFRDVPID